MSMGLISFCSFLSGVGSCAAFQAALKTGRLIFDLSKMPADSLSNFELANTPWIGYSLPIGCIWIERLLLHIDRRYCLPREHFRTAHDALTGHFSSRFSLDTFPHCGRP